MLFVAIIRKVCYYILNFKKDVLSMKKTISLILCIGLIFCFAACGRIDNDSGEYRILELTENKIPDEREFAVVDKSGDIILNNADVEKVLVVFEKSKDRYLELRLTDEGAKKLKKALKPKDAELSITLSGEKIASPVIADDVEENSAIVLGEYEDVMDWFNAIT